MPRLAPEGYPYVLIPALAGIFAWAFGYQLAAGLLWLAAVGSLAFFRDPARVSDAPPDVVLAPADGRVLSVGDPPTTLSGRGFARRVSIFMSPADVHVNRAPITGQVLEARWSRGRKFPAYRDKASELNEHSFVAIAGEAGTVAYKQIAGSLARRVVCDLAAGQRVERGQRVGLIKFGSRVDLFLPAEAEVLVAPGERTRAGLTPVARLPLGAR